MESNRNSALFGEINNLVNAVAEFKPDNCCGQWYKNAVRALKDAETNPNADCNGLLAVPGVASGSVAQSCFDLISTKSGAAASALNFARLSAETQSACIEARTRAMLNRC